MLLSNMLVQNLYARQWAKVIRGDTSGPACDLYFIIVRASPKLTEFTCRKLVLMRIGSAVEERCFATSAATLARCHA